MHSHSRTSGHNSLDAAVADLAILGFFFAMRSCENTEVPVRGRTRLLALRNLQFWDSQRQLIHHSSPLLHRAHRLSVTFDLQKNLNKRDTRTQERTSDPAMCPVRSAASMASRIHRHAIQPPPDTPINFVVVSKARTQVTQGLLRHQLRETCRRLGGKPVLGYGPDEIGTKSIRSGAAMALFLQNHSVSRIMILGRWSSDAFLAYIRPQVLEWTNNMSRDMIALDNFFHATDPSTRDPTDPLTPLNRNAHCSSFTGPTNLLVPRLHIHH